MGVRRGSDGACDAARARAYPLSCLGLQLLERAALLRRVAVLLDEEVGQELDALALAAGVAAEHDALAAVDELERLNLHLEVVGVHLEDVGPARGAVEAPDLVGVLLDGLVARALPADLLRNRRRCCERLLLLARAL